MKKSINEALNRIIRNVLNEAVNMTEVKRYAAEIKRNVDALGADRAFWTNINADRQVNNFCQNVFNYGYDIVDAVQSNNIKPRNPRSGGGGRNQNAIYNDNYGNDRNQYTYGSATRDNLSDVFGDVMDTAHGVYNGLRNQGLTIPVFDGMYNAMSRGYYQTKNAWDRTAGYYDRAQQNAQNQQQNQQQQGQQRRNRRAGARRNKVNNGKPLTTILGQQQQFARNFQVNNSRMRGRLTNTHVEKIIKNAEEIKRLLNTNTRRP